MGKERCGIRPTASAEVVYSSSEISAWGVVAAEATPGEDHLPQLHMVGAEAAGTDGEAW
ncbi:hypothetical protein GCM10008997_39290 [Halomonas salifodinae]